MSTPESQQDPATVAGSERITTMQQARTTDRPVLNMSEVAALLGVDYRGVSRACAAGELPAVRIGRRVLIPRLPLLALLGEPTPAVMEPAA